MFSPRSTAAFRPIGFVLGLVALAGCSAPNKANIELRKENQQLHNEVARLERTHQADLASMQAVQSSQPTVPQLPIHRLEKLFTAHALRLGRLTGGSRPQPQQAWDDGLRVYAVPTDGSGEDLKAAGSFVVEAFDLALPDDQRIGQWTFSTEQARDCWQGGMLYMYVLSCPWQHLPRHGQLTLKVTFTDELTGRVLAAQRVVNVALPPVPATQLGPTTLR